MTLREAPDSLTSDRFNLGTRLLQPEDQALPITANLAFAVISSCTRTVAV